MAPENRIIGLELYTLSYYSDYGVPPDEKKLGSFDGSNLYFTESHLPTLTEEGYRFLGWYDSQDYTNEITVGMEITKSYTLYAKWRLKGIQPNIDRITAAVTDIKNAITEKGGTVPTNATIDDLADLIREL